MSKLLFVTSFAADMYEASGRDLIASFAKHQPDERLLVCSEGMSVGQAGAGSRFLEYSLDGDRFLHDWLAANRDIIPTHLGGDATPCDCPGRDDRHARHSKKGCHWQWMNRNASRWFRKVASLRYAASLPYPYVVWVDADVVIGHRLDAKAVRRLLDGAAMFFCKGHRPAVESGVLGFDMHGGGRLLVDRLCDRYTSGMFRYDERWDDGYQIGVTAALATALKTRDLVHPTALKNVTNDVIPRTDLAKYLTHRKGRHGTKLDIMK